MMLIFEKETAFLQRLRYRSDAFRDLEHLTACEEDCTISKNINSPEGGGEEQLVDSNQSSFTAFLAQTLRA